MVSIDSSLIGANQASIGGGIYYKGSSTFVVTNSFVGNNMVSQIGDDIGKNIHIYQILYPIYIIMANNSFSGNTSSGASNVVIKGAWDTAKIYNNSFLDRSRIGLYVKPANASGPDMYIFNSSINGSYAGIYVDMPPLQNFAAQPIYIGFSTIQSGNMAIFSNSQSRIYVKSSIISGNPSCSGPGNIILQGTNFDTDGTCPGATQVNAQDLKIGWGYYSKDFGPIIKNFQVPVYEIGLGSVAMDAASDCDLWQGLSTIPWYLPSVNETDQTGRHRPQGPMCDVGAYEYPYWRVSVSKQGAGGGTVTSNPAGIDCGTTCIYAFPEGQQVTLSAVPDNLSLFGGWGGDCQSCGANTSCTITVSSDKSCIAYFNQKPNNQPSINSFTASPTSGYAPLTVTFSWNVSDPDGDTLTCYLDIDNDGNTDYTINDCANNTSWQHTYNNAGNYTAKLTVDDGRGGTVSQNVSIVVNAMVYYTLSISKTGTGDGTVTSNPSGINCGNSCQAQFSDGTTVTLTATPSQGSVFSGWGGDCSSCGTNRACSVTLNADLNCTAQFDINQPPQINSFTASPSSGTAPLAVNFTCDAVDPDGSVAEYRWDFEGDGQINTTTASNMATFTYNSGGTYTARCTAIDNLGATAEATVSITVSSVTSGGGTGGGASSSEEGGCSSTPSDSPYLALLGVLFLRLIYRLFRGRTETF